MAEFEQSPQTREAMRDAAQHYVDRHANVNALTQHIISTPAKVLAAQAGVSARSAERWRSRLLGKESQQRGLSKQSLEKLAKAAPGPLRMRLDATLVIGGDPSYGRRRTGIVVDFNEEEAADLLGQALSEDEESQDDAWQTFYDVYVCPAGYVEQPRLSLS